MAQHEGSPASPCCPPGEERTTTARAAAAEASVATAIDRPPTSPPPPQPLPLSGGRTGARRCPRGGRPRARRRETEGPWPRRQTRPPPPSRRRRHPYHNSSECAKLVDAVEARQIGTYPFPASVASSLTARPLHRPSPAAVLSSWRLTIYSAPCAPASGAPPRMPTRPLPSDITPTPPGAGRRC